MAGTLLLLAAQVLSRLPERPLVAAADAIGELWYRLAPSKAAQARANLGRVCAGLAAQGRGSSRARRAATDPDALERLVRACFRNAARYYLEVARVPAYDTASAVARVDFETPVEIRDALMSGRPVVLVGMHYGAIELPVVVLASLVAQPVTAPMEAVTDPGLQRWFLESRRKVGINIIPLKDARRPLLAALRAGRSIGLVNDRDLTGTGIPVPFFGADAPISPGPALLAIEAGVPVYAACARRKPNGRYGGKLINVPVPVEGTRRERMVALTAATAVAFETILADGPEQWWGAFHPIWPDLVIGGTAAERPSRSRPSGSDPS